MSVDEWGKFKYKAPLGLMRDAFGILKLFLQKNYLLTRRFIAGFIIMLKQRIHVVLENSIIAF